MEIGIVGLPNVGKSTIFNILTKSNVPAENYPFTTIEPNIGIVNVPDERLDFIFQNFKKENTKCTYATIKFIDIAGLVKGASKGEGLGNKFLSNIREVDAITHVVRVFENKNISHVSGKINPISDIETINTELMLADLEIVSNNFSKIEKQAKTGDKEKINKLKVLQKCKETIEQGKMLNTLELTKEEISEIKEYNFLTIKPILFVFNVGENEIKDFETIYSNLIEYLKKQNARYVKISAKIESELINMTENEKNEFIKEMDLDFIGLKEFIKAAYKLLDLITFFTMVGENEIRAWDIKRGTTAEKAAGKIHSDMERGFIKTEVIKFKDMEQLKDINKIKENGLMYVHGRDYIVEDGDILFIKFNK